MVALRASTHPETGSVSPWPRASATNNRPCAAATECVPVVASLFVNFWGVLEKCGTSHSEVVCCNSKLDSSRSSSGGGGR